MVVSFAVSDLPLAPPGLVACHICLIGLLMICRVPTYSFKGAKIKRTNAKYALLLAAIVVVSLLTYLWATLTCLTIAYIGCLVWAYRSHRIAKKPKG
jgi:CDP-diacylglycerol--serine O-phosphatidyltransferase